MRILVTGAAGQIGSELAATISSTPHHELIAPTRSECDVTNRDHVLGLITTTSPDLIIHCAAMTDVDGCEERVDDAYLANVMATRFVADGARRVEAHVVLVSTDYVFDGDNADPYNEWDRTGPRSVYGRTKLAAESEMDPGWTVARTSWVCGRNGSNMVKTLLRLAAGVGEVRFVDDQRGNPTFVSDLVPMLLKLGVERIPGTFHTTNQGAVSWYEFATTVFEAVGADAGRIQPIATDELDPPRVAERPRNSVLDNMAWRLSGLAPSRHFAEPLAELIEDLDR